MQRFRYTHLESARGHHLVRPMLPIVLQYRQKSIETSGLLDSGADVCVLPYPVGLELGAVWKEQRVLPALSGNLANYETRGLILTVTIGMFKPVRLAFAWTRAEKLPVILGQTNFFSRFDVCFLCSQSVFTIHLNTDR